MKRKNLKWLVLAAVAVSMLYGIVKTASVTTQPPQEETKIPTDALTAYINRLADEYECAGCGPNYRRLDSNGKYSYSCLQFQERTFVDRVKEYRLLPRAEAAEIMNWIYDCDFQKQVARKMFENEPNAWVHWRTSVERGLGMPPQI